MFYFTTEALIHTLLIVSILDLVILGIVLWHGWRALWSADRVLGHIDIEYMVKRRMAQRHVNPAAMGSKRASEQEASLTK